MITQRLGLMARGIGGAGTGTNNDNDNDTDNVGKGDMKKNGGRNPCPRLFKKKWFLTVVAIKIVTFGYHRMFGSSYTKRYEYDSNHNHNHNHQKTFQIKRQGPNVINGKQPGLEVNDAVRKQFLDAYRHGKTLRAQRSGAVVAQNQQAPPLGEGVVVEKLPDKGSDMEKLLSGRYTLIDFSGEMGTFCELNWSKHQAQPWSLPMFRDLVSASYCDRSKYSFTMNLQQAVDATLESDHVRSIPPSGFVFHESRCGSTLVANVLAHVAMDDDDNDNDNDNDDTNKKNGAQSPSSQYQHRVYSESSPLIGAMKIAMANHHRNHQNNNNNKEEDDNDNDEASNELLRNVVHLMGLTSSSSSSSSPERKLFFKIQSVGTTYVRALRRAFPDVPWMFVYRDPVQVMMSHMPTASTTTAVCLRSRHRPMPGQSLLVQQLTRGTKPFRSLSYYESCASHLATLCESMITEYELSGQNGRMVNYDQLIDTLLDDILPNHFKVKVGEKERLRVEEVSTHYSKGRGFKAGTWREDSETKEQRATEELKLSAVAFLYPSYQKLQSIASLTKSL